MSTLKRRRLPRVEQLEKRELLVVFGADGRQVVSDPYEQYPYRAVGQLQVWFPGNTNIESPDKVCTGAMVSKAHVLTSAHCLYDIERLMPGQELRAPRWSHMAFLAGRTPDAAPYPAWTSNARTYSVFRSSQDPHHDIALLTLDRNLGETTGWFGFAAVSDSAYPLTLNSAGYPSSESPRFDGRTMGYQDGSVGIGQANDRYLRSRQLDMEPGQSGSPWWHYSTSEGRRIFGIWNTWNTTHNLALRLTSYMRDDFAEAISADLAGGTSGGGGRGFVSPGGGGSTIVDRPDLTDHDQWFGTSLASISAGSVRPGQTLSATAHVRNNGTAASGSFSVAFYASTDSQISTSDRLLGSTSVNSLGAHQSRSTQLNVIFPEMPSGQYYVGWIIDANDSQTEYRENDNVGIFKGGVLDVLPPDRPPVAQDDEFTIDENGALDIAAPGVLFNDSDPDGGFLAATLESQPSHGSLQFGVDGRFHYTPNSGFYGEDTFMYRVTDGSLQSDPATVKIIVREVNAPPTAVDDEAALTQGESAVVDVLANDADSDGSLDVQSLVITQPPAHGVTEILADGRINFTPSADFFGVETFQYHVADDEGERSNVATVTVFVEPLNYWQNSHNPMDVNDDGSVGVGDLLAIVQHMRNHGAGARLSPPGDPSVPPPAYVDVNGDETVSVRDLLDVVTTMRADALGEAEPTTIEETSWHLVAVDVERAKRQTVDLMDQSNHRR